MKLVLASNNRNKVKEIRKILEACGLHDFEILTMSDVGFTDEIVENGATFEENAAIKAKAIAQLGYLAMGDDSGLCVDALDGAPGVFSARYAGEHGNDTKNNEKLLAELSTVAEGDRTARFVCVLACASPGGKLLTVRGECPGIIRMTPAGEGGFGYDPLFQPDGYDRSFAQISMEEKNAISHRGRAIRAFVQALPAFLSTL